MSNKSEHVVKLFTPTILDDCDFEVYKPEFERVFSSEKATNIAVSGPFGAGKTSVMATWEASKDGSEGHNYLHLSLANFKGIEKFGCDEDDSGEDRGAIEKMLLNQLVHKVDFWRVPKSRFKTTVVGKLGIAIPVIVAVVVALLLTLGFAEFDWYRARMAEGGGVSYLGLLAPWLLPIAALILAFVVRSPFKGLVKRISLGGNEVELFDEKSSTFNRYMDDIIYLLDSSGCDVVVIEDLDRFERLDVFEGLREINNLVNSKRRKRRPIRFFYLVRDDMFTSADRAKFFDLIIPVIPFMDKSNAADVLAPELAKVGIGVELSFLNELSLYLSDPRVLDDVVNNSRHIKAALFGGDDGELESDDAERIVAMSVYKALFPADFADLQAGRGCVKYYLEKRNEAVEARRAEIDREISGLQGRIDAMRAQGEYNADELALLYMTGSYSDIGQHSSAYGYVSLQDLPPAKRIEEVNGDQGMKARFDELVCSLIENDQEFASRYDEALSGPRRGSQRLAEKISRLKLESAELSRMSLPRLIALLSQEDRGDYFAPPTEETCPAGQKQALDRIVRVRESDDFGLIEYLLCSGRINDSYERYMSNFYPTSVTSSDREVLRRIVQHSETDPLYGFDKPAAAARKLSVERFAQKNARILSLCHELLSDAGLSDRRARFFQSVSNDRDYRFVFSYVASEFGDAVTVPVLEEVLPGALATSIDIFSSDSADARRVCQKLLTDNPVMLSDNAPLALSVRNFASGDAKFLHPEVPLASSVVDQLEKVGYSARDLEIEGSHEGLLAEIYSHGLYEPDAALVLKLVRSQHSGQGDLRGPQLSNTLAVHSEWSAYDKVDAHPAEYLQTSIGSFGELEDTESTVVWLVNKPEILEADGLVVSYASALKGVPIRDAGVIEDGGALEALALAGRVARTGRNILSIYAANGNAVTESVVMLVNQGTAPGDLNLREKKSIAPGASFLVDLGRSESVSEEAFASVASGYGAVFTALAVGDLPVDRAESLVRAGSVKMTKENLSLYSKSYPSVVADLARSDMDGYVGIVFDEAAPECPFDEDVALSLLRDEPGSPALTRLVEGFEGAQRVDFGHYADEVNAKIIELCFDERDLGAIGEAYEPSLPSALRDAIVDKCVDCLGSIIRDGIYLSMALRLELLSCDDIGAEDKEKLVSIGCGAYSAKEYPKMLIAAGMDEYLVAVNGKGSYTVGGSAAAKAILEDLERLNLISSFKDDGEGNYRVHAKRKKE